MGYSQSHFKTVWSGNGYNHMNIYVQKATINDLSLQAGDEVAVFENENCVGVTTVVSVANVIMIRASADDPTTPNIVDGFSNNAQITFKIWSSKSQMEITPEIIIISGNSYYNQLATSVFALVANLEVKPVANAGSDQVVAEGKSVKLDGSGSYDPKQASLTYSWISPSNVVLSALSAIDPVFDAPQVVRDTILYFYLEVNNGSATSLPDTVKIIVKNINKAPVITGQIPVTVKEDASFSIVLGNLLYSDDNPSSAITLQILPSESYRFNGNSIIPTPDFNGTLRIIVRIFDGELYSAPFSLIVNITPVNDAPKFASFPLKKAIVDRGYIYIPKGTDVDGDAVTITPVTVPSWLTFSNKELKGTPSKSDIVAGGSLVELAISDGSVSGDVQSFNILIDTLSNAPYLLKGVLNIATVGLAYADTMGVFDVDSDTARITLYNAPSWLLVNGKSDTVFTVKFTNKLTSFTLSGTPSLSDRGVNQLLFVANDGVYKKAKMLPLVVASKNTPPVATDKSLSSKEDEPLLVVLEGVDLETPSTLNYVITAGPTNGTLTRLGRNVFIYRSLKNSFGNDSFEFKVAESEVTGLFDLGTISITVAPVNDRPIITDGNTIYRLFSGESVTLTGITMSDAADAGMASATELVNLYGPFHGSFDPATQVYTANASFQGVDMVYLAAKELGSGGLYSKPISIRFTVIKPNTPPQSFAKTVITNEDMPVSFSLGVSDSEEDISRLSIQLDSLPKFGVITMNGGLVTYTPNANWSGVDSLVYKVIDSQGASSDTSLIKIICLPVNDAPVITNGSISMGGNTTTSIDFSQFFTDVDSPVDSLRVEFLITDNVTEKGLSILKNTLTVDGVNQLLYTFTQATVSSDVIPFRIYDGVSTSLPGAIVVNSARRTASREAMEVYAKGDFYDITYGDSLWVYFTAISNDPSITEPLEIVLTNTEAFNGILGPLELYSFTPNNPIVVYRARYIAPAKAVKRAQGNYTEVIFDDVPFKSRKKSKRADVESAVDTLVIGNIGAKVPTVIAPIGEKSVSEDGTTDIQIFYSDPDTQPGNITWSYSAKAEKLPTATLTKIAAGEVKFTVTPQPNFVGAIDFTILANDGDTTVTKDFRLNVVNVNDAPTVSIPDSLDYVPGYPMSILMSVNDIDNSSEQMVYSATSDVVGIVDSVWFSNDYMMVAHNTGLASDYNLTLTVGDGASQVIKTINMNYREGNNVPQLAAISSIVSLEDKPVNLSVTPTDADSKDMLTVTVVSSDESIVKASSVLVSPVSAKTGIARAVSITPEPNAYGDVEISFIVSDGFSSIAQQLVLSILPVNDAPVLVPISQVSMKPNTSASLPVVVNDVDSYEIVLTTPGATGNFTAKLDGNILMVSAINNYEGTVTVDLTAKDDSTASSTISVTFVVSSTSGVDDLSGNQPALVAYPNPAHNLVTIQHNKSEGIASIRIFDVTGKLVGYDLCNGELKREISVSGLPVGIYIVKVKFTNNEEIPLQIIKK